jgi:hypothetical protein
MTSVGRLAVAGCLLALAHPSPAQGQGAGAAIPVQGLRFGVLTPGLVTQVQVTDNVGRAAVEVTGRGQVTVSFALPSALRTSGGVDLPLHFGPADGRVLIPGNGRVHGFDPRLPFSFALPASQGQASIFLGGAAAPTPSQRPGAYEGEITVTVTISNGNT